MDSFAIEMVGNACAKLLSDNTFNSFTISLPEQLNLEGQWQVAISEKTYPSVYQNVTDRKFLLFDIKIFKLVRVLQFGARLYHSITDNVEAMNTPIQVKHNHTEISIAVKKFRRTQKVEIDLAKQKSYLTFLSAELGHIFKSNIRNDVGVLLRGKEPHHPVFAYDIFRIHSPIINTDFIE